MNTEQQATFKKSMNLYDSTSLVVGSMIGSGIFIVSAEMARGVGAPGWLMVVWLISGIMTIIAALSYGELAGMMPDAGGQYVYLREAYNPLVGFLYGWTLFLVIQTGTIAAVAMAFAKFTGFVFPVFSEKSVLLNVGLINISSAQFLAIATIFFLSWINSRGIALGKSVQNLFTFTKVAALLLFLAVGLFIAGNSEAINANLSIIWDAQKLVNGIRESLHGFGLVAVLGTVMVGALFSSDAWNNITFTGAEIKNPKKNLPLSLFLGTLIVTLIYLLINLAYLRILPLRGNAEGADVFERGMQYATNDTLGAAAMEGLFGQYAAIIMAVMVMISTFGCNNGIILAGARVYYTMAKDNLFFTKAGVLNKFAVPSNGLLFQALWASLLCLSGTYSQLLNYVIFAVLLFYCLTIIGIFVLRYRKPDVDRPVRAIGYPVIPLIYIILAVFIMIVLLIFEPDYTWPGLIIVIIGIPVFYMWRKREIPK